jgi:Zn-dependent protease with chaperone function
LLTDRDHKLDEEEVRTLVSKFAAALRIPTPNTRLSKITKAPCYDPVFNRIELSEEFLELPDQIVMVILAHEVGHAAQRRTLLLDLLKTGLSTASLIAVTWIFLASLPPDAPWRLIVGLAVFPPTYAAYLKFASLRQTKHNLALELDADRKAAMLCGPEATLAALDCLSNYALIREDRLAALRAGTGRA